MKTLETKEWIAVIVSVCVVALFFVFGQGFISLFNKSPLSVAPKPELKIENLVLGTGPAAVTGDRVVVSYIGTLADGSVFDSSVARKEPFQFVLGSGQVIKGWDEGIVGMQVGGKRRLTIPPDLAYGANDYGPIPGGSTIMFEVELLKIDKPQ